MQAIAAGRERTIAASVAGVAGPPRWRRSLHRRDLHSDFFFFFFFFLFFFFSLTPVGFQKVSARRGVGAALILGERSGALAGSRGGLAGLARTRSSARPPARAWQVVGRYPGRDFGAWHGVGRYSGATRVSSTSLSLRFFFGMIASADRHADRARDVYAGARKHLDSRTTDADR